MTSRKSEDVALLDEDLLLAADEEGNDSIQKRRGCSPPSFRKSGCLVLGLLIAASTGASWFLMQQDNGDILEAALARTINGSYAGIDWSDLNQQMFLGIPYAAPPLGPLRFSHPRPYTQTWDEVRNATEYGPNCPGYGDHQDKFIHNENCLTINVIRPRNQHHHGPLPVGVYIYGGGTHGGSSSDGRYNLSFIIATAAEAGLPFVGVSFNYRSSIWGFMDSRQVRGTSNTNLGFHDQRLALKWVQENIAGFGGDPRKVTLWGGSSGADDIGYHLVAHGGGGNHDQLFRAAILQSGGPLALTTNISTAQHTYDALVVATNCHTAEDSLKCLRGVPYAQLSGAFEDGSEGSSSAMTNFGLPAIDGSFIRQYGSLSLKEGRHIKVPILNGVVANEGSNVVPRNVCNWTDFRAYLIERRKFPAAVADRLMALYPKHESGSDDRLDPPIRSFTSRTEYQRVEAVLGDLEINAADRLLCETYSDSAGCYSFRFDALTSSGVDARLGVTHGTEIGPVFQNTAGVGFEVNPFANQGPDFYHMSRIMGLTWAGFITHLDPNVGLQKSNLRWPPYTRQGRQKMIFNGTGAWIDRGELRPAAWEYINSIQHSVLGR